VPAVAPDEIKTTWKIYAEMEASHPGELVALVARADPEDCFKSATSTARAVGYRTAILRLLQHAARELPEQFPALLRDNPPPDAVFEAMAKIPMENIGTNVKAWISVRL
jgi:hypothetical protein